MHKAEQSLPAWRGAGRSSRGTKPLLSTGDGARSCRIRLWCLLLYCGYQTNCSNKTVNRKTELCHHRPQTKAHSNEYENNTQKAEQSRTAWRGAGRSSRGTKPLLSSGDGARSCRVRLWCLLLYCEYQTNCSNKIVNRKTELCHHRPQTKAHSNEYENNAQGRTIPTGLARRRQEW